jgi:hypothetical protein
MDVSGWPQITTKTVEELDKTSDLPDISPKLAEVAFNQIHQEYRAALSVSAIQRPIRGRSQTEAVLRNGCVQGEVYI